MPDLQNSTFDPDWRVFIETSPMYGKIAFQAPSVIEDWLSYGCRQIETFCHKCKETRFFNYSGNTPGRAGMPKIITFPPERTIQLDFVCQNVNCHCEKYYYFHCQKAENQVIVTKIGEWPSATPRVERAIQEIFPKSADLLKKGVVCLNEGYGVGAFAYFRQVLEPHIELLLREVEDFATETNDTKVIDKIAELRKESPMSEKIAIAKEALPAILNVEGVNPLGTIYGCLSEDIHNGSDEECLQKAQDIYSALSFILHTLANFKKVRNEYTASLKSLQRHKGR